MTGLLDTDVDLRDVAYLLHLDPIQVQTFLLRHQICLRWNSTTQDSFVDSAHLASVLEKSARDIRALGGHDHWRISDHLDPLVPDIDGEIVQVVSHHD